MTMAEATLRDGNVARPRVGRVPFPRRADINWLAAGILWRRMSPRYKVTAHCAVLGLGIALLSSSCVIKVSPSGENIEADAGEQDSGEPCSELDALPDTDIQAAFEDARAQFESAGVTAADVWRDPQRFGDFFRAAYKAAGCEIPAATAGEKQQGLQSGPERIDYCGWGHSTGLFFNSVSTCLNAACMRHDACYARCSTETGPGCMWDGPTDACDRAFRAERNCDDDVRLFRSAGVRILAAALDASSLSFGCDANMVCPGTGPCQRNPAGSACTKCLAIKDTGGQCLAASCADNADVESCYLATCDISGCFGGHDLPPDLPDAGNPDEGGNAGAGGAVETGDGGTTPHLDASWTLAVLSAAIPPTDVDGTLWDVGGAEFIDPDPYVVVRAGSPNAAAGVTPTIQDTRFPVWLAPVGLISGTMAQFQTYLSFKAMDADAIFDDAVGFCETLLTASDFDGAPKTFVCFDGRDVERFSVTYRLSPSG